MGDPRVKIFISEHDRHVFFFLLPPIGNIITPSNLVAQRRDATTGGKAKSSNFEIPTSRLGLPTPRPRASLLLSGAERRCVLMSTAVRLPSLAHSPAPRAPLDFQMTICFLSIAWRRIWACEPTH